MTHLNNEMLKTLRKVKQIIEYSNTSQPDFKKF